MAPTIPTSEPTDLVAGDTWKWNRSASSDYAIADGWNLTYAFRGPSELDLGPTHITESDETYLIVVPAATTAALTAGIYEWGAYATNAGGERYRIDTGTVVVRRDLATAAATLTHAEKCLAAVEAVLEGRITADVESFQINGRAVNKIPVEQLRKLRTTYRWEVYHERNPGQVTQSIKVGF